MNKIKILSVSLLMALSTYVLADDIMIIRDQGIRYTFTCQSRCVLNLYSGGGWRVTDQAGGSVHYVLMAE